MVTSVVDICNNALVRIGSKTITSLTDGDKVSNACNTTYSRVRDTLLRMHLWNFAVTRQELASEVAAPVFGYAYSFPLPSDFIRAVRLDDNILPYKIEQGKLLTDSSEIRLVYVSRIEDVTKFDPLFVEALILMLAINLSYILIGSNPREAALKEELKSTLFLAKQVDGQDDVPDQLQASTFLDSKLGFRNPTLVLEDWEY